MYTTFHRNTENEKTNQRKNLAYAHFHSSGWICLFVWFVIHACTRQLMHTSHKHRRRLITFDQICNRSLNSTIHLSFANATATLLRGYLLHFVDAFYFFSFMEYSIYSRQRRAFLKCWSLMKIGLQPFTIIVYALSLVMVLCGGNKPAILQ